MSGYNAEASQPRETEVEPIVLETTEEIKPYAPWDLPGFRVSQADQLAKLEELDPARLLITLQKLREESLADIQAHDHRIQHIWEQAGEIADQKGYCDVFETFMDGLGTGYSRDVDMVAYVKVSVTIPVYYNGRKNEDATNYIENYNVQEAFNECDVDLSIYDWEIDYTEEAN